MQASQDDIDISAVAGAVKRNLPRLLAITILVGVLTYGLLTLVPPTYKSTAQIILQPPSSSLLRPSGESGPTGDLKIDESEVASQAEVIRSRDLLSTVVAAEHLTQVPQFNSTSKPTGIVQRILTLISGSPQGADANERALWVLEQNLRVGEIAKTRLINIDVTAQDAKLAAQLANAIAQSYLDRNRASQVQDASDATTSIGASIAEVKRDAETAEADLERFRAESGLLSGQNNVTLNNQQLSELNTQLTQAAAARTEAEARSLILRDMIASGHVEDSQDVVKSPNMQALFQQKLRVERDIAELSTTLLPAHPRMRQLAAELAIAEDRMRTQAKQVAAGIEDDLKVARARESALRDSLAKLTDNALKSSDAQAKLGSLEREAQSKRKTYDGLLQRLNEASSRRTSSAVSAMASLNERAVASTVPDSPKKTQMSVFAMLGTLLLGLVWSIARALMGSAGVTSKPARPPAKDAGGPAIAAGRAPQTASRLAGTVALAQLIGSVVGQGSGCRILLTGESDPQDLKGPAVDLAAKLASADASVVLIDLLRATDAGATPGFGELVAGQASFEQVVRPESAWHWIGRGAAIGWPQMGSRTELVLGALAENYRYVIVVAPRTEARSILEALEGQFDVGVVCAAARRPRSALIEDGFLGYDVENMTLAWLDDAGAAKKGGLSRLSPVQVRSVAA